MTVFADQNEQIPQWDGIAGHFRDAASTTQKFRLGKTISFADGRKFRYISTKTSIGVGQTVKASAATSVLSDACTAADVGATELTVTQAALSGASAGDYKDGFILVTDDAGEGYSYKVKDSTAADSNAVTFTLYDEIQVAITTASDVVIQKCQYKHCDQGDASSLIVGVLVEPTSGGGSTEQFAWVQVSGIAVVKVETSSSLAAGKGIMADASGGVAIADGTLPILGGCTAGSDDYQAVNLSIE